MILSYQRKELCFVSFDDGRLPGVPGNIFPAEPEAQASSFPEGSERERFGARERKAAKRAAESRRENKEVELGNCPLPLAGRVAPVGRIAANRRAFLEGATVLGPLHNHLLPNVLQRTRKTRWKVQCAAYLTNPPGIL